ncbi:hypothetical protein [Sorangium sp. So ce131]|uniref:hypothetical protein n=1 Tax=Sorangium sp. So ce131 TaxID=3133282 RepID=UPI003F62177F
MTRLARDGDSLFLTDFGEPGVYRMPIQGVHSIEPVASAEKYTRLCHVEVRRDGGLAGRDYGHGSRLLVISSAIHVVDKDNKGEGPAGTLGSGNQPQLSLADTSFVYFYDAGPKQMMRMCTSAAGRRRSPPRRTRAISPGTVAPSTGRA